MMKVNSQFFVQHLKRIFKSEETRFFMITGLKVSGISLAINFIIMYIMFLVMRLNLAFFLAHGFPQVNDPTVFYDSIVGEALDNLPVLFAFHIFLFFIGVYVGWLMLRPFRVLGEYCEKVIEQPNAIYKIDEFSNFRLLTRFSEFFFEFLRESRRKGSISANSVPPQYSRIHKPVLDVIFLLHFGILLIIIAIASSVFIIENSSSVFESMVELANRTLTESIVVNKYFANQMFILDELVTLTIILVTFSYTMLGFHLYAKVSGAAFGIFSTMRAYMKGAHFSRVHLVGYTYIRENTRKLNKYLEYVERTVEKEKSSS
jgi:hypothetical protein